MERRVVITGLGIISPIGNDIPSFKASLKKGRSGQCKITSFDDPDFPVKQAFEVKDFDSHQYRTHILDPFIQYAVAATHQAVEHAGFDSASVDPYRIGISVSSSKGGMHTIDRFQDRFNKTRSAILGARIYTNSVPNFAAQWIARRFKIKGPAKCYVAACATGTVSIIEGARMIEEGVVDYCLAGASDASIVPLMLAGYRNMKALSKSTMRPFDNNRDGFLVGEGSGIVFMESLESAKARQVKIYGEVLNHAYGSHCLDAIHFQDKDAALQTTIEKALKRAQISAQDLDYISLHGTGTKSGDVYETNQIKQALGKRAYQIPMSSTKSMVGHMLGASGAVEAIATLLAFENQFVPPTVGLETKDPACDLDYVPNQSRECRIKTAMSLSLGFGGHVAALILRKS